MGESPANNNKEVTLTLENTNATGYVPHENGTSQEENEQQVRIESQSQKKTAVSKIKRQWHKMKLEHRVKSYCSDVWTVKTLKRKLPIINWLPRYTFGKLRNDLIAGFTVGLTVIPQGLAYAAIAGLDLQYGLYSAFMGCFIYCFLGTSKDISLGPTAIMSILVSEYAMDPWTGHHGISSPVLSILLSFLTGVILIVLGIFRLGAIVRFISHPVISGFTSAAAFVIAGSQLKKILGVKFEADPGFFPNIIGTFKNIPDTRVFDVVLGIVCVIILFSLKIAKQKIQPPKNTDIHIVSKILYSMLWFVTTARNAIVVLIASVIAYGVTDMELAVDERPFSLTKEIPEGLPHVRVPNFTHTIDGTNITVPFSELVGHLGSGLAVIPLMALLESIAIASAFARKNNYKIDATQELMALGIANFVGSFFGAYPVTGSFSRSAVNSQSNVATPAGGIMAGVLVVIALAFLSSAFVYIPTAALGAVIIMAVINMFDAASFRKIAKTNWPDLFPLIITFGLSFWDLAYGIIAGICVSLLMILIPHAMPAIVANRTGEKEVVVDMRRGLDFAAAEYFERKMYNIATTDSVNNVYLNCSRITTLDYSAIHAFHYSADAFQKHKIVLHIVNLEAKLQNKLRKGKVKESEYLKFANEIEENTSSSVTLENVTACNT